MNFTIKTIGCKVNTYESQKIKDELIKLGFNYIDVEDKEKYSELDFYIVNTCSVTKIADKKSRQMLHLAKKYNKDVKVIAIGCMVDSLSAVNNIRRIDNKSIKTIEGVDYIVSNKEKPKLVEFILSTVSKDISKSIEVEKSNKVDIRDNNIHTQNRIRAFVKIQDGCNQYCTYCIIPFLRGNIKSRDNEDIIEEIKSKASMGVKEIVLTGIHLSSFSLDRYNKTYESEGAIDISRKELLNIISQVSEIDGIERIRLGSLEPRIIDESFLNGLTTEKFCYNFCLSLQSGCDKTLKRMNRHYTTSDYEKSCELIRKYIPYATITTDVIVGFPGETDEDFQESLSFVKKMRFYNPNIFPYSRREGTKADKMENQLTNEEKHRRTVIMIDECAKISKEIENEYFEKYKDRAKDVLIEEYVEENGKTYGIGYTKEYIKCRI